MIIVRPDDIDDIINELENIEINNKTDIIQILTATKDNLEEYATMKQIMYIFSLQLQQTTIDFNEFYNMDLVNNE